MWHFRLPLVVWDSVPRITRNIEDILPSVTYIENCCWWAPMGPGLLGHIRKWAVYRNTWYGSWLDWDIAGAGRHMLRYFTHISSLYLQLNAHVRALSNFTSNFVRMADFSRTYLLDEFRKTMCWCRHDCSSRFWEQARGQGTTHGMARR